MASQIRDDKCTKCGACATACPTHSIFEGSRAFVVDSDTCTNCLLCAPVCPTGAIENPAYRQSGENPGRRRKKK